MIPGSSIPEALLLYRIDLVVTTLSLCGSLIMCFLCLRVPSPTTLSLKFILAMSIADFFYSIANVLSNFEGINTQKLCWIESNIRQVSFILSIFFAACTAIASYRRPTGSEKSKRQLKFFKKCVIIGPLLCLLASVSGPLLFPKHIRTQFGPINCSLASFENSSVRTRLIFELFYRGIPIMLGLIVTIVGYLGALRQIKKWQAGSDIERRLINQLDLASYKLLWYPAVSILIFLPIAMDPIVDIFYPIRPFWLRVFRIAIPHSIGFVNALVYIWLRKLYLTPGKISVSTSPRKDSISGGGSNGSRRSICSVGSQ